MFVFLNLGKWVDISQKPIKADIVVCLGGGTIDRVKKSIKLIKNGYAKRFLLLGESWYNQPYIKTNYPNLSVTINQTPKNTKEEVKFIIKYMKNFHYHTTLIVTDPPHTRRVKLLISKLSKKEDKLNFRLISSDVRWWNKELYYQNKRARDFVFNEVVKNLYFFFIGV